MPEIEINIQKEVKILNKDYYESFKDLYEDFRLSAVSEYKFELEPLSYPNFIESFENKLINCIIYTENNVPEAFLIYTTAISESIELNIIHSKNFENIEQRSCDLLKFFIEEIKEQRREKVVCYPMLGRQEKLVGQIAPLGFKFVGIAVFKFLPYDNSSRFMLKSALEKEIYHDYSVVSWNDDFMDSAVRIIHEAFETSSDALFDTRFKTLDGTYDILNKIVTNIYADYMPAESSVLLYKNKPIGFCFVNITSGHIVNIPIVGISKAHQDKGLSKFLLASSLSKIISLVDTTKLPISEINTNTETNNYPALKMYRHIGFKEDYNYPQAYMPILKY
ncbi:GNAT family N-acetyltransferase [bacterium]|nr:GNAT family N-acetyltransferase [bacterium]